MLFWYQKSATISIILILVPQCLSLLCGGNSDSETAEILNGKTVKKVVDNILTIGSKHAGQYSVLFTLASFAIKLSNKGSAEPSCFDMLQDQVEQGFRRIEDKISEATSQIGSLIAEVDYRTNVVQDLTALKLHVMLFYKNLNADTLDELKTACQQHPPGDTLNNMHLRFTHEPLLHIDPTVGVVQELKFDLKKYELWMQKIRADMAILVWNIAACHEALNITMSSGLQAAYDQKQMDIIQALEDGVNFIMAKRANFRDDAIRDVRELLSKLQYNKDNRATVDEISQFLNEKYPYVYWSAVVYDPCSGYENHGVNNCDNRTNCWSEFRIYNKNIFLLWSPICKSLTEVWFTLSGDIENDLDYFGNRPVLIVKSGNELKAQISSCVSTLVYFTPTTFFSKNYAVVYG